MVPTASAQHEMRHREWGIVIYRVQAVPSTMTSGVLVFRYTHSFIRNRDTIQTKPFCRLSLHVLVCRPLKC